MNLLKISILIVIASTTACGARHRVVPVDSKSYKLDAVIETTVGNPMVTTEDQEVKRGQWIGVLRSPSGYEEILTKFKKELIYSGKSGDTVNISYREYGDDYARPAFAQELKYDLKSSKEIRFQNYRFSVLSADNSSIKFKVLGD